MVDEESAGQRLDNFLLRQLKGVPKTHVYRVIRSGEVRVNKGRASADAYLTMHSARLASFGITDIRARLFDINHDLTAITHGPLA